MKLSNRVRRAVRIMVDLAQQEGQLTPLKHTVERQQIKAKYAEHIIAVLRTAGLVTSVRGARGGYLLARPAKKISLGDIMRAVDNPYEALGDPRDRGIEKAFEQARTTMWRELDAVSLEEMAR